MLAVIRMRVLPDEEGCYHETPDSLSKKLRGFAEKGWLNIVGGCCGTTPAHIAAIREAVDGHAPRKRPETIRMVMSFQELNHYNMMIQCVHYLSESVQM